MLKAKWNSKQTWDSPSGPEGPFLPAESQPSLTTMGTVDGLRASAEPNLIFQAGVRVGVFCTGSFLPYGLAASSAQAVHKGHPAL